MNTDTTVNERAIGLRPVDWRRHIRGVLRAGALGISRRITLLLILIMSAGWLLPWIWPLELLLYPIPLYAALSLSCVIVLAVLRSKRWAAAAALCCVCNAAALMPWYLPPSNRAPASAAPNLRVLSVNINGGKHYAALVKLIKEMHPDVVCMQEHDRQCLATLQSLAPTYTCERMDRGVLLRTDRDISLCPASGNDAAVKIKCNGREVTLLSIHAAPTPNSRRCAEWNHQELGELADFARRHDGALILAGDFNSSMWTPWYRNMEKDSGLINTRRGFGVIGTHMKSLRPFNIPIDHIMVSREIQVAHCWTGVDVGSDHLPVFADLYVPPGSE